MKVYLLEIEGDEDDILAQLFLTSTTGSTSENGVVMLVPAAFGERVAEEACLRFRNAAFVCFAAAIIALTFVISLTDRHGLLAQQAASLGAACWLVAMMMTFCFAYYASKRRAVN